MLGGHEQPAQHWPGESTAHDMSQYVAFVERVTRSTVAVRDHAGLPENAGLNCTYAPSRLSESNR